MRTAVLGLACAIGAAIPWLLAGRSGAPVSTVDSLPAAGVRAQGHPAAAGEASDEAPPPRLQVPAPPFSEGIFPCSECHNETDMPSNPLRRPLVDAHDDIVLKHDEEHRWCLDCHDSRNRDQLHLASGEPVPFEESYRLCGQCHGEKYRDWRVGVHGRRVGQWNGAKEYLLCVHCHNPHRPRFKPLTPKPAPIRPVR